MIFDAVELEPSGTSQSPRHRIMFLPVPIPTDELRVNCLDLDARVIERASIVKSLTEAASESLSHSPLHNKAHMHHEELRRKPQGEDLARSHTSGCATKVKCRIAELAASVMRSNSMMRNQAFDIHLSFNLNVLAH